MYKYWSFTLSNCLHHILNSTSFLGTHRYNVIWLNSYTIVSFFCHHTSGISNLDIFKHDIFWRLSSIQQLLLHVFEQFWYLADSRQVQKFFSLNFNLKCIAAAVAGCGAQWAINEKKISPIKNRYMYEFWHNYLQG